MKNDVTTIYTACLLENPTERAKPLLIPQILVNSNSKYTWISAETLEKLGVTKEGKGYTGTNERNEEISRNVGFVTLRIGEAEAIEEVIFAESGDREMIGSRSLENLNLQISNKEKKLVPPLNRKALLMGLTAFIAWFVLLIFGNEVDTRPARALIREWTHVGTATPVMVTNTLKIPQVFTLQVSLPDGTITNFNLLSESSNPVNTTPTWTYQTKDYILAVPETWLCWIWTNLIFLSAAACALSKGLSCVKSKPGTSFRVEVAWSIINGFCIVMVLVCGKIFLGDNLEKTLGISDALSSEVLQSQYLRLAMFASLIGLFVGLSQDRITEIPKQLPILKGFFK